MVVFGCDACTFGLGRCCGSRFSVHWSFSINLLIQIIFALLQYASSWKYLLLVAIVWGPACLLALVFHEWGHIGATRFQKGTYTASMLWPLGGLNDCTIPDGKCYQELFIAISGPMMNVPLMFIWIIVLAIAAPEGVGYYGTVGFNIDRLNEGGAGEWFAQLAKKSLDINIMIFALNLLLPAYPLDAASMVAALCGQFGLPIQRTAWVLVIIGAVLGLAALIIGILYIVAGSGPGVLLLLLGLYVLYTSWLMYGQIQAGTIHSHPIFKPDCYHRNQSTALSNSAPVSRQTPPVSRQTPPVSPRKSTRAPESPTKISTIDRPLPKRGEKKVDDIEMGKIAKPKKSTSSKKKAPADTDPTSTTTTTPKKKKPKKKPADKKKPPSTP